ncbi:MAG: DUF3488 and transglutaminase-like domain-containing protein [Ardenticatenaceae bacterium]
MSERLRMSEGWLSFILLFLLLLTLTISLQAADWAPGLGILNGVLFGAFLVGVLFAKSRLSGLLLHPLSLVLGGAWIGYLSLDLVADGPWEAQLAEVIIRAVLWSREASSGGTSIDTLPFVLTMAGLLWLIVYGAAWDFFRARHIWGVLLPSGIAILVNTYYSRENLVVLLLAFLILAFLLVIRTTLFERELEWRSRRITFSSDIEYDFMREGALFALAVVAIAWLLPATIDHAQFNPALTRLSQPWGRAQQEWGRLFSALNYRGTASGTWFGQSMNFHGPLTRSNTLIMHVKAPTGRYWRAVVRDRYTSAGWTITNDEMVDGPEANADLPGELEAGRERVRQEFSVFTPAGTQLFAANHPLEISMGTRLMLGGPGADQETPGATAVTQLFARTPLYQGQTYSVISAVPTVDIQSLRAAGNDYPTWIEEHYTKVPDTVPARVGELARELTHYAENPYDKASLLETYLRSFPYNELIPGPRPGEDGVDYFLFREKQGYCDYYASAMAVMLRTQGIPTRLAAGYNRGTALADGTYEVRQINAHTWVEVYFPGYGWIEFEPTASEPFIERPTTPPEFGEDDALSAEDVASSLAQNDEFQAELEAARAENRPDLGRFGLPAIRLNPRMFIVPVAVMGGIGIAAIAGWFVIQRRWRGLDAVERFFDQLAWVGRALGHKVDPTLTPREYAEKVSENVPTARSPLQRLADLFSKQRFGHAPLADEELQEAEITWIKARKNLLRGIVERFKPDPGHLNGRVHGYGRRRK